MSRFLKLQCWGASTGLLLLLVQVPGAQAGAVKIERLSPPPLDLEVPLPGATGTLVNVGSTPLDSGQPAVSADGQWVAFVTAGQVFERSRTTGAVALVSAAASGGPGDGTSSSPAASSDGRFVAFVSGAHNLVTEDSNGRTDIFVWDRTTGKVEIVSLGSSGEPSDGDSASPAVSADGDSIAFVSSARNLMAGSTAGLGVFVRDRLTHRTETVNIPPGDTPGPVVSTTMSADGRFVTFGVQGRYQSGRSRLYMWDRQTGSVQGVMISGETSFPVISGEGRFIVYSAATDVPFEISGPPTSFGEWRGVAISLYDLVTGKTEPVSAAASGVPAISGDGRFVAFESDAAQLIPGDTPGSTQIYVLDRQTGAIERVSVNIDGTPGNKPSGLPAISADGHFVAFTSHADNLVPGDDNAHADVFVAKRE